MARNELGELRRSGVVSVFGPGSIVDFRAGGHNGAPVSAVVAGLEEWDRRAPPDGLNHLQVIYEARLQRRLGVGGFRLPPVQPDQKNKNRGQDNKKPEQVLPAVRFPVWLQCPECHTLQPAWKWSADAGDPAPYCGTCSRPRRRVHVVPVRFVVACEAGHLDEFPWERWVQHRDNCERRKPLKLRQEGAGLAGLILRCGDCDAGRSMEGVFQGEALRSVGVRCRGQRPWLAGAPENCDLPPRVVQRGASNLYFPVIHSSLDIPPWCDALQQKLEKYWDAITRAPAELREHLIAALMPSLGDIGMTAAELTRQINLRVETLEQTTPPDLRYEEYLQFTSGVATPPDEVTEFEIRPERVPDELRPWISSLVRVVRLREVRAISHFTRIKPPPGPDESREVALAPIQTGHLNWLPGIEVRGEGIFLRLDGKRLTDWEQQDAVNSRAALVHEEFRREWQQRTGEEGDPGREVTPRLLLLHALAHTLMRQLSLECGYSSTALRERLYVDTGDRDMAGVLIYTATTDADGTLGGLARQGLPERMAALLPAGLASMQWCSSDPLCIEGMNALSESFNLAACHSCLLAPETSCEEFNRFLDRAMLVGTPDEPDTGYFRDLL